MDDVEVQRHEIARHYDSLLWTVPTAFVAIIALELQVLDKQDLGSNLNGVMYLIGAVSSWVLLLLFNKIHFQQIRLSEEMKGLGDGLSSYYSIHTDLVHETVQKLTNRIKWWEGWLAERHTTWWVKLVMILAVVANVSLALYVFVPWDSIVARACTLSAITLINDRDTC